MQRNTRMTSLTLPTVLIMFVGTDNPQSGMGAAGATCRKESVISPGFKLRKLMPSKETLNEATPVEGCCNGKNLSTTGAVAEYSETRFVVMTLFVFKITSPCGIEIETLLP